MLEVTVDKFIFRVEEDRFYSQEGIWIAVEGGYGRLGLTDFAQLVNGDLAFARVKPVGTEIKSGEAFADIETVKAILELSSPVTGRILEVNPELEASPELINQAPYGKGWLVVMELERWEEEKGDLLDAPRYLALVKQQAETEMKK
ncbi:MAG: glycine cleavage system protein H [Acidobacteriota bacterium]